MYKNTMHQLHLLIEGGVDVHKNAPIHNLLKQASLTFCCFRIMLIIIYSRVNLDEIQKCHPILEVGICPKGCNGWPTQTDRQTTSINKHNKEQELVSLQA